MTEVAEEYSDVFDEESVTEPEPTETHSEGEEQPVEETSSEEGDTEEGAEPQGEATETEGEPPDPDQHVQGKTVPLEVMKSLREENKQLKQQLGQNQQQKPQPRREVEYPDPILDPKGYAKALQNQQDLKLRQTEVNISARYAKKQYGEEDYSEKEQAFLKNVIQKTADGRVVILNQKLFDEFNSSDDPGSYIYEKGKAFIRLEEISKPEYETTLKEKILAEAADEVMARVKANLQEQGLDIDVTTLPDFTGTAAAGKNAPKRNTDEHGVPDDVQDIWD